MKKKELAENYRGLEQHVFTANVRFGRRLDESQKSLSAVQDQLTGFEGLVTRRFFEDCAEIQKLQEENKQLKQQLFNLSENFDCLNNTVNEIMKREAIRDRGIKIPCPSTDEYDKLMEQKKNTNPTWTEFKKSQEESQQHYFETMQKVREEVANYSENKKEGVVTEVSKKPSVEIVVATDLNGVIGVDGAIPWDCPEDRKLFKELTTGHVVVMGRKTYESLPEQFKQSGLPGRTNIVMSRDSEYASRMNKQTGWENNSIVFSSNDTGFLINYWKEEANGKIFIIGGEEIYKLWMPYVDVIHHSRIETEINTELANSVAKFEFVDADWGCLVHEVRKGFTYSKLLAMPGCKEA